MRGRFTAHAAIAFTHEVNGIICSMSVEVFFCTGAEPGKWFDRYHENTTHPELITSRVDDPFACFGKRVTRRAHGEELPVPVALTRLPDPRLSEGMHRVVLYTEEPGIAVGKETELAEISPDKVYPSEIEGEIVNWAIGEDRAVDVQAVRDGLAVSAAGVGIVLAPRPLLKVLSKKQIKHFSFASERTTDIALVWLIDDDCDAIQDLVGTMKGRTRTSSRGSAKAGQNRGTGKAAGKKTKPQTSKARGSHSGSSSHHSRGSAQVRRRKNDRGNRGRKRN
ncbi:hypothetical protein I6I10_11545 [Corynebacterium glucuronolyticum]|uniref:LysR family transcriptional regulator n=2 Tax=Corynebacterium glucuronolyticum TaxID=39791 RepID=A0A7T4EET3_9CORY|nr:hypothetical protein I6I10_11545 [Corynebacterium glucuronolyticum]